MNEHKRPEDAIDNVETVEDELTEAAILRAYTLMEPISANLQKCIEQDAQDFFNDEKAIPQTYRFRPMRWVAVAAVFIIAMTAVWFTAQQAFAPSSPLTYEQFVVQASDSERYALASSIEKYQRISGHVDWSDQLQTGFIYLKDIPENDPTKEQYQLWIVDPKRDKEPVDGGVFDVKLDEAGEAYIAIDAKLAVNKPTVFAITLEQPGGVVVSEGPLLIVGSKK